MIEAVVVPVKPAARPRPQIYLETLPPTGLISCYGVFADQIEPTLEKYSDEFRSKVELWKSNVKKLGGE